MNVDGYGLANDMVMRLAKVDGQPINNMSELVTTVCLKNEIVCLAVGAIKFFSLSPSLSCLDGVLGPFACRFYHL